MTVQEGSHSTYQILQPKGATNVGEHRALIKNTTQALHPKTPCTRRGPLVVSWVINWAKYGYKFHKL